MQSADGQAAEDCVTTDVIATVPRLEIQLEGPENAEVGEEVTYTITVTNVGNAPATGLVISDRFDRGLTHAEAEGRQGITRAFGDLAPSESRTIYITFDVAAEGRLCHEVEVANEAGLRAVESACVVATAPAEPPAPAFTVEAIAPAQAIVGDLKLFKIVVENTGDVPLRNVEIEQQFEDAFEPRQATEGYTRINSTLTWTLESLAPGERRVYEVEFEMMRATEGGRNAQATAIVTIDGQFQADQAEVEILPRSLPAEPPPAAEPQQPPPGPDVAMEITESADPVKAGTRTTYQVFLVNNGQQPAFDVTLHITYSAELGPVLDTINQSLRAQNIQAAVVGQTLRFTPVRELSSKERIGFTLPFDAMQSGTGRLEFSITSRDMAQPMTYSETVEILPR
jgi:uncharacterized repeat protein (TIGR01451 family)